MDIISVESSARIDVTIGDMSASRRSVGYYIGPDVSSIGFEAEWPATGAPVGALALEVFNNQSASAGAAHPDFARADIVAGQPSGGAGSLRVDRIRTSFAYVCVTYTRTSGGTGATPTVRLSFKRGG